MCLYPDTVNALVFTQYPMRFGELEMTDNLSLSFAADEMELRSALAQVRDFLSGAGFSKCVLGSVEIVLAEAANNVIEHAYADVPNGQVEMRLKITDTGLDAVLEDEGAAMPNGKIPEGRHHDLNVDLHDLPEGGFGWSLIREMTDGLTYNRIGERNQLSMHMRLDAAMS